MKQLLLKNKAILIAGAVALFFGFYIIRSGLFNNSLPIKIVSIFLIFLVFVSTIADIKRKEQFNATLREYVALYQISFSELGEMTGFGEYAFEMSTKNQVSFVYLNNATKSKKVLTALKEKYGPLPTEKSEK